MNLIKDAVVWWSFQEPAGEERVSAGRYPYRLQEVNGPISRAEEGVLGPHAARIEAGQWLRIPRAACPALNIHEPKAQVTVAAWVKWSAGHSKGCEAIAGMWDETRAKRQYCLFLNLRIWDSQEQVCGHVSSVGGPTAGYKYCMDASIGSTAVVPEQWQFVAFTYDGMYACSYLDGKLDERETFNPYRYEGGLFDGGEDGSDFTVCAVDRSGEPGNFFSGLLGGLAVYDRALSSEEIAALAEVGRAPQNA